MGHYSWVHLELKKYTYYDEEARKWAIEKAGLLMSIGIDRESDRDADNPNIILAVSKEETTLVNFNLQRIKRQFNSSFRHYKILAKGPSIGFKILSQKNARVEAFKFQVRFDEENYQKAVFLLNKCGCNVEGDDGKYESMEESCFSQKRSSHLVVDPRPTKKLKAGGSTSQDVSAIDRIPDTQDQSIGDDDDLLVVSQYLIPPTQVPIVIPDTPSLPDPGLLPSSQGLSQPRLPPLESSFVDESSSLWSPQVIASSQTLHSGVPDWSQNSNRHKPLLSQPKKPVLAPVECSSSPTTAPLSPKLDDDSNLEHTLLRLFRDGDFVSLVDLIHRATKTKRR
ncbi:hypothetical protein TRVA0_006S03510 [Trichomonascus vanleenenianus]|uniref:uncharacterized protein n=1 Tax=Trichomonascus vanleenenianus TaxID=2268995 RepID=UPI003ECA410A